MRYIVAVLAILIVVGAGVGVYVLYHERTNTTVTSTTQKERAEALAPAPTAPPVDVKRIVFSEVSGSGVTGEGTLALKGKEFTYSVRLNSAPDLDEGQQYEAYIVPAGAKTSPILGGSLLVAPPNAVGKYVGGGGGDAAWFNATKLLITRRTPSGAKPGKIVAEAVVQDLSQ